jgi:hypothetical protein
LIDSENIKNYVISSRNILTNGRSNKNVIACLEEARQLAEQLSVTWTPSILQYCLGESLRQIDESRFRSAGLILNLIHNLPLTESALADWSLDYFISLELATFLENFDEIHNARDISLCIFQRISDQYSQK